LLKGRAQLAKEKVMALVAAHKEAITVRNAGYVIGMRGVLEGRQRRPQQLKEVTNTDLPHSRFTLKRHIPHP
jgi:hypothetical protein